MAKKNKMAKTEEKPNDTSVPKKNPKKIKKKKPNKPKKSDEIQEKDLQIKKKIQADPQLLKQELEVFIKNLNKEGNIQEAFVLKDDEVSDVDNEPLSGDEDEVHEDGNDDGEPIQSDEISSTSEVCNSGGASSEMLVRLKGGTFF